MQAAQQNGVNAPREQSHYRGTGYCAVMRTDTADGLALGTSDDAACLPYITAVSVEINRPRDPPPALGDEQPAVTIHQGDAHAVAAGEALKEMLPRRTIGGPADLDGRTLTVFQDTQQRPPLVQALAVQHHRPALGAWRLANQGVVDQDFRLLRWLRRLRHGFCRLWPLWSLRSLLWTQWFGWRGLSLLCRHGPEQLPRDCGDTGNRFGRNCLGFRLGAKRWESLGQGRRHSRALRSWLEGFTRQRRLHLECGWRTLHRIDRLRRGRRWQTHGVWSSVVAFLLRRCRRAGGRRRRLGYQSVQRPHHRVIRPRCHHLQNKQQHRDQRHPDRSDSAETCIRHTADSSY